MRAFGAVAGFASLGAIAFGGEAERYAQSHRAAFSLMSISKAKVGGPPQPYLDGVDYATTGSFEPEGRRELVVLVRCNDILGEH